MTEHPLQQPTLARFRLLLAQGQSERAEAVLRQALAQEPNLPRVHLALARLRWPGPDYRHWLAWLHRHLQPRLYIEIGVEKGESLALARASSRVIGIDPSPVGDLLSRLPAHVRVYPQSSAEFFGSPPRDAGLQAGFDLAFVDGDHRFESVLDDLIGLEAWAAPGALVVIHDTLPLTSLTAAHERRSGFYTGDGWKIVPCLRALRPDLQVVTLPVAPTGLTLVAGLTPGSQLLRERREPIVQTYSRMDASRVVERPESAMGSLGVNDERWVTHWLHAAGVQLRS